MAVDELLARVWPGFFQQAFVVTDLEAAQQAFSATLGCKRYNLLPAASVPYRYRGEIVDLHGRDYDFGEHSGNRSLARHSRAEYWLFNLYFGQQRIIYWRCRWRRRLRWFRCGQL